MKVTPVIAIVVLALLTGCDLNAKPKDTPKPYSKLSERHFSRVCVDGLAYLYVFGEQGTITLTQVFTPSKEGGAIPLSCEKTHDR